MHIDSTPTLSSFPVPSSFIQNISFISSTDLTTVTPTKSGSQLLYTYICIATELVLKYVHIRIYVHICCENQSCECKLNLFQYLKGVFSFCKFLIKLHFSSSTYFSTYVRTYK